MSRRAGSARSSLRSPAVDDGLDGLKHDEEVEAERHVLEVVEIVLELFLGFGEGGAVAVPNLRPAGEARANEMAEIVEGQVLREHGDELGALRAGAYEVHVDAENVPELRDFVEARLAHEPVSYT